MESRDDNDSANSNLPEILDRLIDELESTKKPLQIVTAMINVTMYRGPINKFKSLIRTRDYGGFDRRSIGR